MLDYYSSTVLVRLGKVPIKMFNECQENKVLVKYGKLLKVLNEVLTQWLREHIAG